MNNYFNVRDPIAQELREYPNGVKLGAASIWCDDGLIHSEAGAFENRANRLIVVVFSHDHTFQLRIFQKIKGIKSSDFKQLSRRLCGHAIDN